MALTQNCYGGGSTGGSYILYQSENRTQGRVRYGWDMKIILIPSPSYLFYGGSHCLKINIHKLSIRQSDTCQWVGVGRVISPFKMWNIANSEDLEIWQIRISFSPMLSHLVWSSPWRTVRTFVSWSRLIFVKYEPPPPPRNISPKYWHLYLSQLGESQTQQNSWIYDDVNRRNNGNLEFLRKAPDSFILKTWNFLIWCCKIFSV